jgi:hypothetical protein
MKYSKSYSILDSYLISFPFSAAIMSADEEVQGHCTRGPNKPKTSLSNDTTTQDYSDILNVTQMTKICLHLTIILVIILLFLLSLQGSLMVQLCKKPTFSSKPLPIWD